MNELKKWSEFEKTGKISDYLEYCLLNKENYGRNENNENNKRNSNKTTQCRG